MVVVAYSKLAVSGRRGSMPPLSARPPRSGRVPRAGTRRGGPLQKQGCSEALRG
eukprot:CAMPEP_0204364486 /NCGR_PEP_ID=MMETSP0469-20131031/41187_1 /ASSEMBLY_ACC=CAM_ASM_000384 /TAXON_ID=2969 /ORGANISM="Oxyrrhis marina" /LENGTH=53 /DNA_ID=CAMNT_0051353407 /DNA_START=61 /DNA_END=219 /DNA_ORIENTATION=-